MILTYERFKNPFRNKQITQDDFDIVGDLFLEISDGLKETEWDNHFLVKLFTTSAGDKQGVYDIQLDDQNSMDQFCMFIGLQKIPVGQNKMGSITANRDIVIAIKLYTDDDEIGVSYSGVVRDYVSKRENYKKKIISFINRLKKYKFYPTLIENHGNSPWRYGDPFTFKIIISK